MTNLNKGLGKGSRAFAFKKRYLTSIGILIILSVLNISVGSDEISSRSWTLAVDFQVTPVTLLLVAFFWLPVLLP